MNTLLTLLLSIIVSATMDSTYILIGEQTDLHLQATADREARVLLPVPGEQLVPGIEVLSVSPVDTVRADGGLTAYKRDIRITSFQDTLFLLPEMPFLVDGDTIYSASLTLNVVQPFELDSSQAITDIKPIEKAPIWWWGILRWILLALLIAALAAGGYYLYRYLQRLHTPHTAEPAREPERPAEEIAREKLDIIREQKVWQQGQTKEYHTQLTDVIREYIGRRYDIHSTEKTSDETLREMKVTMSDQRELYSKLEKMLRLADLVKFAKWTTTPDENEQSLKTAYDFVNETATSNDNDNDNANEN